MSCNKNVEQAHLVKELQQTNKEMATPPSQELCIESAINNYTQNPNVVSFNILLITLISCGVLGTDILACINNLGGVSQIVSNPIAFYKCLVGTIS